MTWSDPRGYDPMIALSAAFEEQNPGVKITWDKRSLQGFESTPVDQLAADYDLLIIDHPHVGAVARQGCLLALDELLPKTAMTALANETVGKSFISYAIDGHQWALPVDAATQVQAHRPDLGNRVGTWSDVKEVAKNRAVILPMRPPHSLICIFTLAGNIGHPCGSEQDRLLPEDVLGKVFSELKAVSDHIDPECFGMDPIAAMDRLAEDNTLRIAPLTYLYKGYSNKGYRANRLAFSDIPALGRSGPVGSALGGTGIAVSSRTGSPELCAQFAAWAAGAECQSGLYAASNGQPGNAVAWASEEVNAPVLDAYRNTRLTHEAAWLRPRHDGYMAFQAEGAEIVNEALTGKRPVPQAVKSLNRSFAESFKGVVH
ncbi:extracellular solute-binding protein [Hoeflea prorocentri]|uniref:Extracellular solute-binding protein n=1 Tax=Hoeflea prorocentri TaxID=1922333 RepID=A0A9X3UJV3_9HYPH|nr:extracellular solute-binding protein [Hoeflea prorocentri]MCY6381952.1 extracellular solute-binding protein [Hoeflea prorocentri]MDA5399752.1 extracellular solute-binding protein [Hoeflea prorocentri]